MPPHYKPLEAEWRDTLSSMAQGAFLDGKCYEFAVALSRGLGRPMAALMEGTLIRHAALYTWSHTLFDVRGEFEQQDPRFGEPFAFRPPYTFTTVTEEKLAAVRPLNERAILMAGQFAETLWPELPWIHSKKAKVLAFAEELEALSRKHGLWLRSPYETAQPVLCDEFGPENGYLVQPTPDGGSFFLNRRLNDRS